VHVEQKDDRHLHLSSAQEQRDDQIGRAASDAG
jgi:hypothetical protein